LFFLAILQGKEHPNTAGREAMNVTHPNYGQNYQLTRAALRLRTFTVSELEDLTGAVKNTVYSFVSKLRQVNEGFLDSQEIQSLRGRPQKRFVLTESGRKYLAELSFELASRFGEDAESSRPSWDQSHAEAESAEEITLPSDIYEEGRELVVQVDVPGMSEEDLAVRVEENDLIVSGERPAMLRHGAIPFRIERKHGHFIRSYPLPHSVHAKIVNVEVRNGVLEVILRKDMAVRAAVASASGESDLKAAAEMPPVVHRFKATAE
jgi:HSP20 family protein